MELAYRSGLKERKKKPLGGLLLSVSAIERKYRVSHVFERQVYIQHHDSECSLIAG